MAFKSVHSGIAASVYLCLYVIYLCFSINIVRREGLKTIYTSLVVYGVFRVSGQMCGVVFAALGFNHWHWLIAYLVLNAEGYFVLIITSYHLIANAQYQVVGYSWIRPNKEDIKIKQQAATSFLGKIRAKYSLARVFHLILIPANALVISGGIMLAGADDLASENSSVQLSRRLRVSGQSIFLFQTIVAVSLGFWCFFGENIRHINIYGIFIASPFILTRGTFGVMSIYLDKMDYFEMSNYNENGISSTFIAFEYTLATTMEFITAVVYISIYYISKKRQNRRAEQDEEEWHVEEKGKMDSNYS
ncbi:predicted protein [Scheffersomyces stipitis CBS 6054]|uniref:Uncharacterized protein n=1 Tax=Scheffersomyces stipitis (strain ATCC 58785 / CBS 6054 / NBRC 10063 / NRRL Y-11545) TaxID=322104 RepID=A3LPK4_PICST|nr:predicted protein [Scheffersomyces stipitis CBS 6054]ABN65058.2 predicted protein [Scheffersomyces stipitis CBS 6054]KAG2736844.1 hypothetical protein G9P44_000934 [Scheffersomyces stipitis]